MHSRQAVLKMLHDLGESPEPWPEKVKLIEVTSVPRQCLWWLGPPAASAALLLLWLIMIDMAPWPLLILGGWAPWLIPPSPRFQAEDPPPSVGWLVAGHLATSNALSLDGEIFSGGIFVRAYKEARRMHAVRKITGEIAPAAPGQLSLVKEDG
jgi:hypothetical protein